MIPIDDAYFAIYENGNHVEKSDLKSITSLSGYKYLIKRSLSHVYETSNPKYPRRFFHYFSINSKGEEEPVSIGNFECLDIGKEQGSYYYDGTLCKILDKRRNSVHDLVLNERGVKYFHNNLLPILEELNRLGSWDSYMLSQENIKLQKEIERLSEQVRQLTEEISDLKNKGN